MGYLGRKIGVSQDTGPSTPTQDGAGGGIMDLFDHSYFARENKVVSATLAGLDATGGTLNDRDWETPAPS